MNVTGTTSNQFHTVSAYAGHAKQHVADGLSSAKRSVDTQFDKAAETKAGKTLLSFVTCVKKACCIPVKFVRNHPNVTIAAGLAVTLIGSIAANPPAIGIGLSLVAVGALAQSANRNAQMKEAIANMQQGEVRQSGVSQRDFLPAEASCSGGAQVDNLSTGVLHSEMRPLVISSATNKQSESEDSDC